MERFETARRLIVNADDFGRSSEINQAIVGAHRSGILTSASLMVNEADCDQAVELARKNPGLGVGLHLSLICGRSALPQQDIPLLTSAQSQFSANAVAAGIRFFFNPRARSQIRAELRAQFEKFRATQLVLDHVNGHLNIHLHPAVLKIILNLCQEYRVKALRLTRDPLLLNLKLENGRLGYRLSHGIIFSLLSSNARPRLRMQGIRFAENVFGLLQNGEVNESFILRLLDHLPPGCSELYSHPSLNVFRHEYEALLSPKVREKVRAMNIKLIRYQDL